MSKRKFDHSHWQHQYPEQRSNEPSPKRQQIYHHNQPMQLPPMQPSILPPIFSLFSTQQGSVNSSPAIPSESIFLQQPHAYDNTERSIHGYVPPYPPTSSSAPTNINHYQNQNMWPEPALKDPNDAGPEVGAIRITHEEVKEYHHKKKNNLSKGRGSSPDSEIEGCPQFDSQDDTEFKRNLALILPVRVLAYGLGLHTNPNKSWRYRDIKRLLFDNISSDQEEFIKNDPYHKILVQRLPNKLSMEHFCRRLLLLAFHFILRDGRKPKFWKKDSTRKDIIERVLKETGGDFLIKVSPKIAVHAHVLVTEGMTIPEAIKVAEEASFKRDGATTTEQDIKLV
jgi:hypothetical protein